MASLGDVFTRIISPQTTDLYWNALKDLAIEEVEQAVKSCIKHSKHFPKPADIRQARREAVESAPRPFRALPLPSETWLGHVNGFFITYLAKRRLAEHFQGDINITERRRECISLAKFFQDLEAESDPAATLDELRMRYEMAMNRVQDSVPKAA